jgi:hypothetical protein
VWVFARAAALLALGCALFAMPGCADLSRPDLVARLVHGPDAAHRVLTSMDAAVIPPTGFLYTEVHAPVSLTPGRIGDRKGVATAYRIGPPPILSWVTGVPFLPSISNWFAWGDASARTAAKNGRITRVTHVDYRYQTVLTVFQSLTLEVYGTGDE